jgi:hypothetical protein
MVLPYFLINGGAQGVNLDITDISVVISETSGRIDVSPIGATSATSYRYKYALQSADINAAAETTTSSSTFAITGLTPGSIYKVLVRAYNGATFGDAKLKEYIYIPKPAVVAKVGDTLGADNTAESPMTQWNADPGLARATVMSSNTQTWTMEDWLKYFNSSSISLEDYIYSADATANPIGLGSIEPKNKSLLSLTNTSKNKAEYSIAYKSFTEIPTNKSYYAFGSTILLDSSIDVPIQTGGMGFFVANQGSTGYYIRIRATASIGTVTSDKEVEIVKVLNGNDIPLIDSQKSQVTTISGIYAGKAYKVDTKVKVEANKITITAFINGFKITATDTQTAGSIYQTILPVTNSVAMFAGMGTVNFDYIYGMAITEDQYNSDDLFNIYTGKFADNQIEFFFGERMLDLSTSATTIEGRIEEFGTVAREIRKYQFKFSDRPSIPIAPTTGANDFIKIVGSKITNFGAEAYVLNNSGFATALSSDTESTFMVYGYSISKTGTIEYDNFDKNLYTSEEPIIFETKWLQNEYDVKALADWLKSQWSKKQTIITLQVFGNPLIQVGDVIRIEYPYHGLINSQKFIILGVSHNYENGLDTTITCRTIS